MTLEKLVSVCFTVEELKEALVGLLDCKRNDLMYDHPDHVELSKLIDHLRANDCSMDWVDGQFCMSVDGVLSADEIDLSFPEE